MRLLVDSHVIVGWLEDPSQLKPRLRSLLHDPENAVYFSSASVWELCLKKAKGKLKLSDDFVDILIDDGFEELPVTSRHGIRASELPPIHQDPFDRMLIAQSLEEGLMLATHDRFILRYEVPTILA